MTTPSTICIHAHRLTTKRAKGGTVSAAPSVNRTLNGYRYSATIRDINNRGEIGGWLIAPLTYGTPVTTLPAIWRNGKVAWTGDPAVFGINAKGVAMNDAGTLVVAKDINAAGVVVGSADGRATLWVNGQAVDLAVYLASKGVSQANTFRKARLTAKP